MHVMSIAARVEQDLACLGGGERATTMASMVRVGPCLRIGLYASRWQVARSAAVPSAWRGTPAVAAWSSLTPPLRTAPMSLHWLHTTASTWELAKREPIPDPTSQPVPVNTKAPTTAASSARCA